MKNNSSQEELREEIENNFDTIKNSLAELVEIPGVAWESYDPRDQVKMSKRVQKHFEVAGLENVEILSVVHEGGMGKPAIVGEKKAKPGYPTVLLYAHHDVQPEGDIEVWDTPPFKAIEKNGRLYGRGVADDKAGIMVHVSAINALTEVLGKDKVNIGIKVFIEGEEEIGSPTFRKFIDTHKEKLEADAIIVADSMNWAAGKPAVTATLRGMHAAIMELEVMEHAVHSGMYGGPIIDALTCMSKIIASFHDEKGNVAIEGLLSYDDTEIDMDEKTLRKDSSVLDNIELAGEGTITSRLWTKPAMSIIGIDAPDVNVSSNTILPKTRAKYSLRVAPGQDPYEAQKLVEKHVRKHAPYGTKVTFSNFEYGKPFKSDTEAPHATALFESLSESWDTKAVSMGGGGSIPFTTDLQDVFPHAEVLCTGVEDPDSRAHSPNESLLLEDFKYAIIAEAFFLAKLNEKAND
ncbi:MAG: M20/M25/M40 family metallo-hydrolase [Micrococcaceae bacterium]